MGKTWGQASNRRRDRLHRQATWTCKESARTSHSLETPSPLQYSVWEVTPSSELPRHKHPSSPDPRSYTACCWAVVMEVLQRGQVVTCHTCCCWMKRDRCLSRQSKGWAQINVSHADSICTALQHPARCSFPPRGCVWKAALDYLLFDTRAFHLKISCFCACSLKKESLKVLLPGKCLNLLLVVNYAFWKTPKKEPRWRLIYKNVAREYKYLSRSGSASLAQTSLNIKFLLLDGLACDLFSHLCFCTRS